MNNDNQNEQAQVQTNEQVNQQIEKQSQSTQANNIKIKRKHKPLFQEGTLLHNVTYRFTEKVKNEEVSFAKIFWFGLIFKMIIGYILTERGS
jgi:hypothetical protein